MTKKNLLKNNQVSRKIKDMLLWNFKYLNYFLQNINFSLSSTKNFYYKIFFKFNWIRFNFYFFLYWNYLQFASNRYYLFTRFYYLKTMKILLLRDFHLSLYLNTLDNKKNYLVKMQSYQHNLVLSKKRKKALDRAKLKKVVSVYNDYFIPWQLINLRMTKLNTVNYNLYWSLRKLNNIKIYGLLDAIFVNFYNQNFVLSGYYKLKYNIFKKYDFPYNVYYTHYNEVTSFDIYFFLNKFCGIFVKSGKKNFSLNLIKLFNIWSINDKVNFYDLIKYFIFNYIPFVYLKVSMVNRRRITKPTLLTKEKSFFLAIKWWKEAAIVRKERSLARGLYLELLELNQNKGLVVSKFNNLLLSTYNARSDLKVKRRRNKDLNKFLNIKRRRYLNEFIYNTSNDPDDRWYKTLYYNKVINNSDYYNRILFEQQTKDHSNKIRSKLKRKYI